ncbi:hypothetical protein Tco_0823967 [Tanacetum coccineum]|uniref:Uncharacterized protein n=1 Tax=Tanacetum coccineum TaxID=301880 RepID=A0ABQ5AKE0_9ASTR
MFVIEQPIPPTPPADFAAQVLAEWNAVYDVYNEVACLMLKSMTPELHRQFENSSPYEMLQELKSMFEKQAGVERVGLILNDLTSDFAGFVRNYNMHNMRKTIGELHALLIEYENRGVRKLKQGALYLYVGNGVHAQVEAIESFDLILPNGLVICLDNCHYAPTRGVVSVSRLVDNGFIQRFTDYGISFSKNDVLYLNAIPRDGIYEIDMLNLVPKC